jgi:hypothetical protein
MAVANTMAAQLPVVGSRPGHQTSRATCQRLAPSERAASSSAPSSAPAAAV